MFHGLDDLVRVALAVVDEFSAVHQTCVQAERVGALLRGQALIPRADRQTVVFAYDG